MMLPRGVHCALNLDDPMVYYKLPRLLKRRCFELRNISLEHEAADTKHRLERLAICRKYTALATQHLQDSREKKRTRTSSPAQISATGRKEESQPDDGDDSNDDGHFTAADLNQTGKCFPSTPFERNPLRRIADKADDIKALAESHPDFWLEESVSLCMDLKQSESLRDVLSSCETKCNQLLTQIANIDWELHEYEESLIGYHNEIEQAMVRFNTELTLLYNKRKLIIMDETLEADQENISLLQADECDWKLEDSEEEVAGCERPKYLMAQGSEWVNRRMQKLELSAEQELSIVKSVRGLPFFWHNALLIALKPLKVIEKADEGPLRYLTDVRYFYDTERWSNSSSSPPPVDETQNCLKARYTRTNSDHRTQLLLFYFDENPFFTNRLLIKSYHIDKSRLNGEETFDGFWVTKSEGCRVNWIVKKLSGVESFFDFFEQPDGLAGRKRTVLGHFKGRDSHVNLDYAVFCRFRDFIAPHAIVAYSRGNLAGFRANRKSASSKRLHYWRSLFQEQQP